MFATSDSTIAQVRERRREARRRELRLLCAQEARIKQRITQIVREADDDGDWRAAGCSSSAQWLAQVCSSDHRTAVRITRTSSALRSLPALDQALSTGALTLDQVAAAAEFATPASDAELARVAVGKAPSAIALAARTLAPPAVEDDQELYERRALSMSWTRGRRELAFSGRLPLEQGAVFEQAIWSIAKTQRAADKQAGTILEWEQSAADALLTLARYGNGADGGVKRSHTTLIVHISDDEPPLLEGAGPLSPETAERLACDARRLTIKPSGRDLVHSRVGRCAFYPQQRALHKRSSHCQYPGCTAARELEAHHLTPVERGGKTELYNLILLCPDTTSCCTITTSAPAATPSSPPSKTKPDARSPPTNHTHHPVSHPSQLPQLVVVPAAGRSLMEHDVESGPTTAGDSQEGRGLARRGDASRPTTNTAGGCRRAS
jgi:hypothetical protein